MFLGVCVFKKLLRRKHMHSMYLLQVCTIESSIFSVHYDLLEKLSQIYIL